MSKLAAFDDLLLQYKAFNYHDDAVLEQRLHDVQTWMKERIAQTHQDFFARPENQLMAQYFLKRLYGGPDFDALAQQIERLLKFAHKVENFVPENGIKTGTKSVSLAVLATQLDEQVAKQLLADYPADTPLTDEIMRQTLVKLDQGDARYEQLRLLDELGLTLDKYMRSTMMYATFKMCKGLAHKYQFDGMYEFIQEGFAAMKPMKSAATFIQTFTEKEREIIDRVHAGHPSPFRG
ncbi:FFLEELY motif protein [Acinetobacter proteolyticus]|uniref:FFLEELY motif protein n=1 Tax=Acinetobacter proteolyticus TaxID=1776741 RepID=UPI003D972D18